MMKWKALLGACVASSSCLLPKQAHAQAACRASHAVELTIQLEPPEVSAREQLQQRLAAELRARDLEVCPLPLGERGRAHVYVLAPVPDLSPTLVRVHTDDGARLERSLDVAALPAEARPSAIASATDELLSALLESAPAAGASSTAVLAKDPGATAAPAPGQHAPWQLPHLELGLGGGGALFKRDGRAYGAELLARWRPLSRLSATLRVGGDRASAKSPWLIATLPASSAPARGRDRSNGWHAGLDAGVELLEPKEGFGLAVNGGLTVARIQRTTEAAVATPVGLGRQQVSLGSSWELAASAGGEVSYRSGPWGMALGLSVLVPLTPPEATPLEQVALSGIEGQQWDAWTGGPAPPGVGFGEQLGGQLDLRLWLALGS